MIDFKKQLTLCIFMFGLVGSGSAFTTEKTIHQHAYTMKAASSDFDHLLYQQVANSLGVSIGTVHQRVVSGEYQVLTISSDTSIKLVMMDSAYNLLGEIVIG